MKFEQNYKHKDVQSLVKYFLSLHKEKVREELEATKLNKHIAEVDTVLAGKMVESKNADKITVEDIEFKPIDDENYALDLEKLKIEKSKWDSDFYFNWLEEIGEGGLIKTVKGVPANTRKAHLKKLMDKGVALPEWIKVSYFTHMKFNKKAVERLVVNGNKTEGK